MDAFQDPQYKTADGSALRIWRDAAQNNFRSEQTGLPSFDEVIYVEVISPGSRDSTPTFEVVRYFPEETKQPPIYGMNYAKFKDFVLDFEKNEEIDATMAGTPLSQWPELTKSMVASLKVQNVYTVEALASLPDTKLTIVGPDGRTWREKAKAYLENAKNGAYATALAAENERLKLANADLGDQIKALADQVQKLVAAQSGAGAAQDADATQAARGGRKAAQAAPGGTAGATGDQPADPLGPGDIAAPLTPPGEGAGDPLQPII